jgi:hypothetical protein
MAQEFYLPARFGGQPNIIAIKERHELCPGRVNCCVPRRPFPAGRPPHHLYVGKVSRDVVDPSVRFQNDNNRFIAWQRLFLN